MRIVIAILAVVLMMASAHAQGFGGRKGHQQATEKPTAKKPKIDEKAYNAALKTVPNKPYDPWHGVR